MLCEQCGGEKRQRPCDDGPVCLLCDLFEHGFHQPFVEQCRMSKPNVSEALAVHPLQIPEAMEDARRRGVPVKFDKDGCILFESRRQKADYNRAYGYINHDGGYGD